MSAKCLIGVAAMAAFAGFGASTAAASITIPTVPIGYTSNGADVTTGFGSVAYRYNIGRTEVTNAQYTAFLNAVAATDTHSLYNPEMAGQFGGITRSGSPGSYTYTTITGRENHPVNWVSFWDATRFANWLHNGQPTGAQSNSTTEDGAYTLTESRILSNSVLRNANWQWAITSENEWYKAAYHQPASAGGDADSYWLYPTSSNAVPTQAQASFWQNGVSSLAPVGSFAPNFYGALDMGGNVAEWTDNPVWLTTGSFRAVRGGAFNIPVNNLRADVRLLFQPFEEGFFNGFRVSQIPGPSTLALLAIGGLVTSRRRR